MLYKQTLHLIIMQNDYRVLIDKLLYIGTKQAHKRHKILLEQARCPRCGYFIHKWAANNYMEKWKPKKCYNCRLENPLKDVVDPLDCMVKEKMGM